LSKAKKKIGLIRIDIENSVRWTLKLEILKKDKFNRETCKKAQSLVVKREILPVGRVRMLDGMLDCY